MGNIRGIYTITCIETGDTYVGSSSNIYIVDGDPINQA